MHKLTYKILSIFLALVVLISTSGVMVYEHECNCTQTKTVSLIASEFDCCSHDHPEQPACDIDGNNCCIPYDGEDDQKCCETSTKFIKVNTPVEIPAAKQVINNIKELKTILFVSTDVLAENSDDFPAIPVEKDTGPPISGQFILILNQQLKLAPPASASL